LGYNSYGFYDNIKKFLIGYNHRTGHRNQNVPIKVPLSAAVTNFVNIEELTEVGLHECSSVTSDTISSCLHPTWLYFKRFAVAHPAKAIEPPSQIKATGRCVYAGYTFAESESINRDVVVVSVVPFPVTIEVYTGNIFNIFSTNERTSLKDDGTYELNVTYNPDTNYTVIAYPEGDTVARIGAFVRASASKFLTTFGTLEESTLHFPTITLTDDNYQEGDLNIKVIDGANGTELNSLDIEIRNNTGIKVDDDTIGIDSGYITTLLAKGDYTVQISKEGYDDIRQQCTVVGEETTECIVNIFPVGYVDITGSIKKTGQTKSYNAYGNEVTDGSVKDDGHYQSGVAPNYSRDASKEVVTDHTTGLEWQDDSDAKTVTKSWDDAQTHCSTLSLDGGGWRLPTRKELASLSDYGRISPAINPTFQNVASYTYWSSTTYEGGEDGAWNVYFGSGHAGSYNKDRSYYVRCVRAGQ
jgi:hypothetical protein